MGSKKRGMKSVKSFGASGENFVCEKQKKRQNQMLISV